jgi:hypothetical protein
MRLTQLHGEPKSTLVGLAHSRDGTDQERSDGGPALNRIARDYDYTVDELRKLSNDLLMSTLRMELFFDETSNWHDRMPALHIDGGGSPIRVEAEHDRLGAIAFALEGDPREFDSDSEAVTLDVTVAPAAQSPD